MIDLVGSGSINAGLESRAMRFFKQKPPLGCAFGSDGFRIAAGKADAMVLRSGELSVGSLKQAVGAASPGRNPRAIICIPNRHLLFRALRLAPMPDGELASAAHWKISDETGLDPQNSTSQIVTAWGVEEGGKQKTEVLAVVAKNQDLEPYLDIADGAGLTVSAIDLASSAICRSLSRSGGNGDQLLLMLEEEFAGLIIAQGGNVRYMRTLQADLARLGQLRNQLSGESGAPARVGEELEKQVQSIYCRELSREISLAVRYYEETVHAGAPERGVILPGSGFAGSAAKLLANLTSIGFQLAPTPPEAMGLVPADSSQADCGSEWHVPIGLLFYEEQRSNSNCGSAAENREATCA